MSIPSNAESSAVERQLRSVRALYFTYFASFGLMSVYLNVYLLQNGLSGKQIGTITGTAALLGMLGGPVWGALNDRFGLRRVLMAITVLGAGFSALGLAASTQFPVLMIFSVSNTFFVSSLLPLIDTMNLAALRGHPERYGKQRAWGTVGYILATFGVGLLLARIELRVVFAVYFLIMLTMLLIVRRMPTEDIHLTSSYSRKFLELVRTPAWQLLMLSLFVFGIGNSGMHTYLSMYLLQLGASETLIGATWALGAVAETGFMALGGALIQRIGARTVLPLAFVIYSMRLLAYAFMQNSLLALPLALVHAVTFAPFWLSAVVLVNQITPRHLKATGQALLVAVLSLSSVVGSPVAGAILDASGMRAVFQLFSACTLAAALIFFAGNRLLRRFSVTQAETDQTSDQTG